MTTVVAPAGSPPADAAWGRVAGVDEALARGRRRPGGRLYGALRWGGAAVVAGVFGALAVTLVRQAWPDFAHMGLAVLWGSWNPGHARYGAGVFVVGTAITTVVALVVAVPVGLGTAILLSELSPRRLAAPFVALVEFLAAVPSIVIGLWGLVVLTPLFARHVEPFLKHVPGLDALFHGPALGASILLAGVVLAIMVLPTVVALSRAAMVAVPVADREGGMALAATPWQVATRVVLPAARRGVRAAVTLAMGRALGEAIAVAMVIGNNTAFPHSLLAPGATLGSAIVNSFAEANPGTLERSGVVALVVVLLALSVVVNAGGTLLLRSRRSPRPPRGPAAVMAAGGDGHVATDGGPT